MARKQYLLSYDEFAYELLLEHQPRALIILASAHLDTQLRDILEKFLWPATDRKKDELLDGDSPLSTYSSRINIACRLGLIDTELARLLHRLREIRNEAAHWPVFVINTSPLRDQLRDFHRDIQKRKSYDLILKKFFSTTKLSEIEKLQAIMLSLGAVLGSVSALLDEHSLPRMHPRLSQN